MAVEDYVIPVREDALDLAMRVWMIGHEPSDELAEPFHAVLDERIVLAIDGSGIHAERVLNVAFKDRLLFLWKATVLVLFVSDMVLPFRVDLTDIPRIKSGLVGNLLFLCN
jgi:hypothetical protein